MRNEIVETMDIETYHAHEGISNTGLGYLLDCPARYKWEYLTQDHPKKDTPKHFKIGSAVHTLVLEPHLFDEKYCTIPKISRRSNAGKEEYAKALEANAGKILLNEEEFSQVKFMADAAKATRLYQKVMIRGKTEHSFFWIDEEFGVQLKSRPDWHNEKMYIDLKTTDSIPEFHRSVIKYGYARQAAIAREAFKRLYSLDYKYFIYLCVEEKEPFLTASFALDEAFLDKGHEDFRRGVKIYKDCIDTGDWPGYSQDVQQLILPNWVK